MDAKLYGPWYGTSPCDNEPAIALLINALRAYDGKPSELIPPGPRSCESAQFNELSKFCLLPNTAQNAIKLLFGGRKALFFVLLVWSATPVATTAAGGGLCGLIKGIGRRLPLQLQCSYQGQQDDFSQSVRGNYKTRF